MSEQQWTPRIRRVDNDERERLQYIRSLIQEKRSDEARDELLDVLQQNEKSVRAHLMLGSLYQDQGLLAEALDHFKYAMSVDPMDAQANLRAGTCSLRMNEFADAKAYLKTALDLDAKLVNARVAYAQALSRLGESEAAILQVEHALRLDPQLPSARMLLAQLFNRLGRSQDAIEELDGFVNANPDHAGAAVRLALLQGKQGESGKAIELLESAAKAKPEGGTIWSLLGRMKLAAKDYLGAETAFSELTRLQPQDRRAPLRLVSALIPQGKFDQARDLLKRVPRRGRLAGLVHQYYGDIYAAQKMYGEAAQSYRAALLHSEGGGKLLDDVDAGLGKVTDKQEIVTRLQAALAKHRDEVRGQMAERRQSGGARAGGARPGLRHRMGQSRVVAQGAR